MGNSLTAVGRWALAVACALSLLSSSVVAAEASESDALRRQVIDLHRVVRNLEARIERLEARSGAVSKSEPVPPAASTGGARMVPVPAAVFAPTPGTSETRSTVGYVGPEALLRQNWSRIQPAMANTQVTVLLGEPSRKFKIDGRTVWYYYYPATGAGSVFFNDEGRVSSRQSPFGWSW